MLFGSDYDGTLKLNGEVSQENLATIKRFQKKHKFGIVTGRSFKMIYPELVQLDLELDFLVCSNGTLILDKEMQEVQSFHMNMDDFEAIESYLQANDCQYCITDGYYHGFYRDEELNIPYREDHKTYAQLKAEKACNGIYVKIADPDKLARIQKYILEHYEVNALSNDDNLDIFAKTSSKDIGLKIIAQKYGEEEIYAIGDGENDLTMIKAYGKMAMRKCDHRVEKIADTFYDSLSDCLQDLMYNIALVSLNAKYVHKALAIWCLDAGIKAYGDKHLSTSLFDSTIHVDMQQLAQEILASKPRLIGLSCYIWNITKMYELIKAIRALDDQVKICLGGPEVSYNQKQIMLAHPTIDFIISGEGEESFAQLANCLYHHQDLDKVPGLTYRQDGRLIIKESYVPTHDPVNPYSDEFIQSVNKRIVYIETTRGCPFSCDFCLSGRCGKVRFFDLATTFDNIVRLANSGTKTIKFVDRTFNANRERSKQIIRFIMENSGKSFSDEVCFHFEVAGDIMDDETIELLQQAPVGLFQLEIGMQSFNEKTLAYINRKTDTTKLKRNIQRLLAKQNMHIHIDLIVGLPYEDMASLQQSFDTAYHLNAHMLQLGFLKILHGTPMADDLHKYQYVYHQEPPYEIIDTPWLNQEEMAKIHRLEDVLERMNNSGRFLHTLDYIINTTKQSVFNLLMDFGCYLEGKMDYKIDLDSYTDLIYRYFKTLPNIDADHLRDVMVIDRLSTNNTGRLSQELKRYHKKSKHYRLALASIVPEMPGIKRGLEILDTFDQVIYVDYVKADRISSKYPVHYISIAKLEAIAHRLSQ
ncbi:MAG: HAD-IIB family hydrolase [Erysipelotrichaceae bacterium]|nr:HAD-IIB family hydrolase [Erysipelotrichaceae bacterium]MDY5251549.1 HAD-IIB family hydrolase [Erysipelotrichaceae bacterium]